jgi:hypothetical protein
MAADPDGNGVVQLRLEGPADPFNLPLTTVTAAFPVVPVVQVILALMEGVTDVAVLFSAGEYFTEPVMEHWSEPVALKGGAVTAPAVNGMTKNEPTKRTNAPRETTVRRAVIEAPTFREAALPPPTSPCSALNRYAVRAAIGHFA